MTDLVVRRLLIDLQTPFGRNWCGGDAFSTAFFNALSMSFPFGEQFFIDAVRDAAYIGSEATHRRIHSLFNEHLESQGLKDCWSPRAAKRMQVLEGADPRHALAITAATEHFTAMFAEWLLAHPVVPDGAEPRLRTMWLWHSAEELEHKAVAFDLYKAVGGSHRWRSRWFRRVTLMFLGDLMRQTVDNLRHERQLWQWPTWKSAARILLSRDGLLRGNWSAWRGYFRADFHPAQQDSGLSVRWLEDNRAQYTSMGTAPEAATALQ